MGAARRLLATDRPSARHAHRRRKVRKAPPPSPPGGYMARAEASLAAAAEARDPEARALHQEECKLWLILAAQRRAIEDVMARYLAEGDEL